jgi:Tfp pilus assembly protein PilP
LRRIRKLKIKREFLPARNRGYLIMKRFGTILLLGTILTLGSCGGEAPKATKVPMPPAGKKAPAPLPTPPRAPSSGEFKADLTAAEKYIYDPKGKPDPFRPLIVERPEAAKAKPKPSEQAALEAATPLERMDLGQLKLVAVIWNVSEPKGMVEDDAGKGYILSIGTPIGKNRGKVTQINSLGVLVTERYDDSTGKFKSRQVTLKLYPD